MGLDLAYKTQILFVIIFSVIIYIGYNESADSVVNYKRGLQAALFILVAQGMIRQYEGPFIKGFATFWRGVARYNTIYLAALIFLLFQNAHDARQLLKHLYPELGVPVVKEMHTYDDHCDFTLQNFWGDLDHYYAMHVFGWFFASLLIRDAYILHFWSILDEILELSWQHILPHFRECWWDHIFVDLLCSNTPAIFLGLLFVRKTGLREFDWLGRKGKKSIKDWDIFTDHRRFGGVCVLLLIVTCNFLSGFFLINSLWVPPKNYLNIYRLSVWFFVGAMAIGELHDDVESWGTEMRRTTPISNEYRWIVFGVCILEATISYKFRHDTGNLLDNPTPWYISIPWAITFTVLIGFYLHLRLGQNRTTKFGDTQWEIERKQANARLLEENSQAQAAKKTQSSESKASKKAEKLAQQVAAKAESLLKHTNGDSEQERVTTNDKKKEPETKVEEPKKISGRRLHDKQALGEYVEPEPVIVQPVIVAPVEDEWKTIPVPKGGKRTKRKRE